MLPSSGKICEFVIAENFKSWKCARKNKGVCARASHVKDKSWLSPPGARVPKLWIKCISSRPLLSCSGRPALITATCVSTSWWTIPAKWAGTCRATFFLMTSKRCSETVAKSTACLSYVNDPRAFAARNTIDQLAGNARKRPWDFHLPLCSGNAVRGDNEGTGPAVPV